MFDLNFNQRADGFIKIARALEPFNLTWLEIDTHDPGALALVRRSSRTPIGSLESIHGLNEYRPFLEQRAVDVAIIDVHWNGLWESARIATLADAYDTDVAPHNYEGHLASMVSAHFCAAVPNFRIMEIEVDDVPWKDELVTHVPVIENGELVLSDRPGWGTECEREGGAEIRAGQHFLSLIAPSLSAPAALPAEIRCSAHCTFLRTSGSGSAVCCSR
jgi:L-alanine-DL-glutamate epimerase-like enolase superfamily enzyme